MKKLLYIFLVLAVVFSLVACADTGTGEATGGTGESTGTVIPSGVTGETQETTGATDGTGTTNPSVGVTDPTTGATDPTTGTTDPTTGVTDPTQGTTEPGTENGGEETETTTPPVTTPPVTTPPTVEHTHTYTEKVTASTCTEKGYTTYTCSCGDSYKGQETPAAGHKWSDWTETKKPTESAKGEEKRSCGVCKKEETRSVAELGHTHNYAKAVTQATCTSDGFTTYSCSCGHSYTSDTVKAKGHSYTKTVTNPTCTTAGYTTYKCSCGYSYKGDTVAATGHNYSKTVTAPTCTTKGYTTYKCSCGSAYTGDEVKEKGHTYQDTIVVPTCIAQGYTEHKCKSCGYSYKDSYVSETDHQYQTTYSKEATCTEQGYEGKECVYCHTETVQYTPAIGHDEGRFEDEPINCEEFYRRVYCNRCDAWIDTVGKIPNPNGKHNMVTCSYRTVLLNNGKYDIGTEDLVVTACDQCWHFDESTVRFAYTDYEAAVIMLGYVNELRREVLGEGYDLVLSNTLIEKTKVRSVEIITDFSHKNVPVGCRENIAHYRPSLEDMFLGWKSSPGHYAAMVDESMISFGFACTYDGAQLYGVQWFAGDWLD